jgi:hypothetical protein
MWYGYLADAVVAVHVAYVSYVLLGQLAIVVGAACKWRWVRNPWFRWSHVAAIVIVAVEALLGIVCPLTLWEDDLRRLAGQEVSGETFVGRWLHGLIFYDVPPWILETCYIAFALLVIGTLVLVPPRRWRSGERPAVKAATSCPPHRTSGAAENSPR